jgi:predicted site-specific integrase-resolvase
MSDLSLNTQEAAELLGVTSTATVKNWLEGGHFPGAYQVDGEWRFSSSEVLAAKKRIEELREKNRTGDLSLPDCDYDLDLPLL